MKEHQLKNTTIAEGKRMNYNHFEVTFNSNTTMYKPTPQTNKVAKGSNLPPPPSYCKQFENHISKSHKFGKLDA
jgi:hypothetical protein